ncbi:hypothetical protein D0Z00_000871 [Geotrichum galactomycetum]|uniref:Uncharacterized protein n=1 Tax=Geotrichum galactomycetum TaxID=27317 RepID=A0ACB6V8K3_9ASCO|nr:hypothetical protein D0Z00_000871 [Geotrichum candidum]
MTTFLRVISCGLIDLHHQDSNHPGGYTITGAADYRSPRINSFSSSSNNVTTGAAVPNSPTRKNKRLSGQHLVSRLSRRRHRSKHGSGGGCNRDSTQGDAGAGANDSSTNVPGLMGAMGEDFRIRDEDIAVSAYQPSCAASIASSMTRPHLSLTNTSSAFHEVVGSMPPPLPDLETAMAAAVSDPSLGARPRSALVTVENASSGDELAATTPTITSTQSNGNGNSNGRTGVRTSPKSMSFTSNTIVVTPLTSPRASTTIERSNVKPDHIHNHALVVDTALDRHFGF